MCLETWRLPPEPFQSGIRSSVERSLTSSFQEDHYQYISHGSNDLFPERRAVGFGPDPRSYPFPLAVFADNTGQAARDQGAEMWFQAVCYRLLL